MDQVIVALDSLNGYFVFPSVFQVSSQLFPQIKVDLEYLFRHFVVRDFDQNEIQIVDMMVETSSNLKRIMDDFGWVEVTDPDEIEQINPDWKEFPDLRIFRATPHSTLIRIPNGAPGGPFNHIHILAIGTN